ncbi:MAG: divergent polysaccharide deacetylase family protein, partial [Candidatus Delongbacteria bacterium]|nr:divergent polysaccharide deacetylase family protein [Candidatus Delongbacteria bacterium]
MRKLLYILIFVLIIINFFLFYIDKPYSDKYEKYNLLLINENSENEKTKSSDDDFEKIDSAFLGKNFNKKWIYTKKTDSLWYKYIKVPNTYDLARYNLFFQKILRINDIKIQKAEEYELSNKIVFTFAAGDTIPARVELRITQGLESDISLSGSVSVIITGMGNNWGQEWIKNLLESEKPMTISILPDRWATNKIYSEAVNNAKEVIISLPMEPEIGNIDKEKLKILKGMNNFTVDIILDKALAELPKAIGIINYRGERVISDYET